MSDKRFAMKLCRSCVMQPVCLERAIERREQYGVWGGRYFQPPPGKRLRRRDLNGDAEW